MKKIIKISGHLPAKDEKKIHRLAKKYCSEVGDLTHDDLVVKILLEG